MSDSEEVSFASADEGDGAEKRTATKKRELTKETNKQEIEDKVVQGQTPRAVQSKKDAQKETDKQLSKTKGKGNNQTTQKQTRTKANEPEEQSLKLSSAAKTSQTLVATKEELKPSVKLNKVIQDDGDIGSLVKSSETTKEAEGITTHGDTGQVYRSTDPSKSVPKEDRTESLSEARKDLSKSVKRQDLPKPEIKQDQPTPETRQHLPESKKVRESQASAEHHHEDDARTQLGVSSPAGQDIPRGHRDHTKEQEDILSKLGESTVKGQNSAVGWAWGSWGSSLLSAATNSVQTFTHQVGDGFTTILETVESSLGVPNPEDIAKAENIKEPTTDQKPTVTSQPETVDQEEKFKTNADHHLPDSRKGRSEETEGCEDKSEGEMTEEQQKQTIGGGGESWFSNWSMADLAKKVQDTGKSLASKGQSLMSEGFDAVENLAAGGIDVLESIGKKTYDTLSEHDPAFRKTREYLSPKSNKPNLSSILKEAKEKAEYEADQARENEESSKAHFGTLFDNYQGIAHLEALEMLSNQSEKKVHSLLNALSSSDLSKIKPTLICIKEAFEISQDSSDVPEDQDFSCLVSQYVSELELGTAPDKLNKVHEMVKQWLADFDSHESHELDSVKEVHQKSIQALAELTAKGVEQFHKAGELVLFDKEKDKDCTERAHSLARLTGVLCHEVGNLATKFVELLNKMVGEGPQTDEVTPLVTNVYLEATNSSTYIQDAFQLLLPVLQHAALEHSIMSRQL